MKDDALAPLPRLRGEQQVASRPDTHVWLSASAGTGKTQVLAARVFRLLLRGTDPAGILCLTFTKAGAAEMAGRINQRLAAWVRMPDTLLANDLIALGEDVTPARIARARTLFARVLDAPGGGLRIQTIHGFCQGLLAAFPVEAGLVPGFRPIEPREETLLMRGALADLLADAAREGRDRVAETVGALSMRLGEEKAEAFLRDCARAGRSLEALPSGIAPWLRRAFDLPDGDVEESVCRACAGEAIDREALQAVAAANAAWGTKSGIARADTIAAWLAVEPAERALTLGDLHLVWAKADGEPRSFAKGQAPPDPAYPDLALRLHAACAALLSLRTRAAFADLLAAALDVGRDYARGYAAAKRRIGAVDFDDLIATTVALFDEPGIGDWVRFKLDQVTEHVLIDEAQDTNAGQWRIVRALVEEYFVGQGVHAPSTRTLFTVGDHKQAIFGFQGTDPVHFAAAERHFAARAAAVRGDDRMPDDERGLPFERLSLVASFRSTRPVLDFVDTALDALGPDALGMADAVPPHASEVRGPGQVELWPPVSAGAGDAEADEEEWIDDAVRANAVRIARRVRAWIDGGLRVEKEGRALRPEDVMILVKRRGELARLLVARLYEEGVPVAGVDRLRLNAPLAVQDLLAAIRFVLQPDDDLSLAALLVSPLIGWTQDELMARAVPRRGRLWPHLLDGDRALVAPLEAMLARADFTTPYRFLEGILSGALDGRRRLLERLGEEARDPIEELLTAALEFETGTTPSLQRFLDWFDRGDVEIVRDAAQPRDAVRVMTVHGAKGLQAPVVILADATADPDLALHGALRWAAPGLAEPIPVFRPRAAERAGAIEAVVAETDRQERAEHWRLFYVAATRAEERLVIAGSLGARAQGAPPQASWYAASARALDAIASVTPAAVRTEDGVRIFAGRTPVAAVRARRPAVRDASPPVALPDWAHRPAPEEARPPRPLSPSSLGQDEVADPPPTPAMRAAAARGRLIHALFERLPAVPAADRAAAGDRWLARAGGVAEAGARAEILAAVLRVLDDAAHAALFGAGSLGEAPVSAVLDDGTVVAGTVDRLLLTDDRVRVVDFKTGRQALRTLDEVPPYHLRQMAAYAAALAVIFPDRRIDAALLYTAGPVLIDLPAGVLARAKPGYRRDEQSSATDG